MNLPRRKKQHRQSEIRCPITSTTKRMKTTIELPSTEPQNRKGSANKSVNQKCRATTYHKNLLAKSLVQSYPMLASKVSDIPQALWFYVDGRGPGRHAGKIHYHLEYLAKQSGQRVINRKSAPKEETCESSEHQPLGEIELITLIEELKFVVPTEDNKTRIAYLWDSTFDYRCQYRANKDVFSFLEEFPVASAFDGELIDYDFKKMKKNTVDFTDNWKHWQEKVLQGHRHLFREISNDFVRALAIIRAKNPTRGSKRLRDEESAKENPLKGIIDWVSKQIFEELHVGIICVG
ncbi:uncharacterized protein LOC135717503 [Ochlerotatus camptorhynchus]|uniref:uncharacterized protein LOC135717503 n=1 Tax=Ochlerotatus camptorhynchus TaxID=644619 RepID=UPI0031E3AB4C